MNDLLLRAGVVVRTSNIKISRRRLGDYVKKICTKKRAALAARIFFCKLGKLEAEVNFVVIVNAIFHVAVFPRPPLATQTRQSLREGRSAEEIHHQQVLLQL